MAEKNIIGTPYNIKEIISSSSASVSIKNIDSKDDDFWFDFVADSGDGFNATYTGIYIYIYIYIYRFYHS